MANGFGNVLNTFKAIGSNIIQGKFFTGVPVSKAFQGTLVGKFASFITKPASIFGVPAAVAAAPIAVRALTPALARGAAALRASAAPVTSAAARGVRSLTKANVRNLTKFGLGAAAVGGAFKLADVIPRLVSSRGAAGLIRGTGEINPFGNGLPPSFETDGGIVTVLPDGSVVSTPTGAAAGLPGEFDPAFFTLGQQPQETFGEKASAVGDTAIKLGGVALLVLLGTALLKNKNR